MRNIFPFLLLGLILGGGTIAYGQEEPAPSSTGYLIVCDGPEDEGRGECDFQKLMLLVKRGLNLLIFVSIFVAVAIFMYAGFLYLTSTDKRDQTGDAKKMMKKTAIGIILILLAWVAVYTVFDVLDVDSRYNWLAPVET